MNAPPKNSNWRTWIPIALDLGPGTISTVAGVKGTALPTEPRVATVAQARMFRWYLIVYCPVAGLVEVVPFEARSIVPAACTTANRVFPLGQTTARWNGTASCS